MDKEVLYQKLRDEIQRSVGHELKTPKDFDILVAEIEARTHVRLSSYTLKRFWGYLKQVEVRRSTLDVLCQTLGYTSWSGFEAMFDQVVDSESHMSFNAMLDVLKLKDGTHVRLLWNPGRCVIVRYEGHGLFVVEDSVNSKLKFGDTFRCYRIVAHEPLVLTELKRPGKPVCSYVCGQLDGVVFNVLEG